jgi:3-phenylpropionate/cinnamic acid dioxygenase small subunit
MEYPYTVDERAIVSVALRYARSIDTKNAELFMSCFTEDALFGLPKLRMDPGMKLEMAMPFLDSLFSATQHVTTNFEVDVSGDKASLRSLYIATHVWRENLADPLFVMGGHYQDTFVRSDDGWRIQDRLLVNAWFTGDREAIAATGMGELLE